MDLSEKLGPLPVYAWGGMLGAAAVGYYFVQSRKAASATATTSTDTSAQYATTTAAPDVTASDGGSSDASVGYDALSGVVPLGYASNPVHTVVDNMSAGTTAVSTHVITGVGPRNPPSIEVLPQPGASAKPKGAVQFNTYRVQHGDTYANIGAKFHILPATVEGDNGGKKLAAGDVIRIRKLS